MSVVELAPIILRFPADSGNTDWCGGGSPKSYAIKWKKLIFNWVMPVGSRIACLEAWSMMKGHFFLRARFARPHFFKVKHERGTARKVDFLFGCASRALMVFLLKADEHIT